MGKIVNKIIQAINQNDEIALSTAVLKGCKKEKLSIKKLEGIVEKDASTTLSKVIQGARALNTLAQNTKKESQVIECAFLAETALSDANRYIKQESYALQLDPTTQRRFIHVHDALIGKGYSKVVTAAVEYDRENPRPFVSCEAEGDLTDEVAAMKQAEGLPGVIQAEAVMRRTTSDGKQKTSIIQKVYSPGPLYRVAGKLSLVTQIAVAKSLLIGLQGLHGRDLIHRDIKPDNILYDEATGEAVLADLGQTKSAVAARDLAPNATPLCNPPEAMLHDRTKNDLKKADIFSLGCTLYRMHFDKKLPWMKDSLLPSKILGPNYHDRALRKKCIKKVKNLRYKLGLSIERKPPTVETKLKQVILRMLHQEPEKRPSIGTLLEILR